MNPQFTLRFSPTRLKQMKKIALSGSRAKLKILNGKLEEGFQILKTTAQKFKSFATDLADRIPQTLAAQISLNLFAHFEKRSSKKLGIPKGVVLGGVLALMASLPATGQTINVANTNDTGAGSLRQAILDANANPATGIIRLANGTTYTIGSNLPIVTGTDVGGALSIICTGTTNAIIDGNNLHRPLTMTSGSNLTLSKITIQNGSANKGGAIYNKYGDLTISDCLITQNKATAGHGGGIYNGSFNNAISVLIENSTISNNSASSTGGGLFSTGNISTNISNSTLSNNSTASSGGGIRNNGSTSSLSIASSTISGNVASTSGGGIYNNSGNVSISSSSITGNRGISSSGGGVSSAFFSNLTIQASTIANNQVGGYGGGIITFSGAGRNATTTLTNCTISGNTALREGGGMHSEQVSMQNNLIVRHTTFSDNAGATHGGLTTDDPTNVTLENSIIANSTGNDFNLGPGGVLTLVTATIVEDGTLVHANATTIDPLLGALTLNSGFLIHPLQVGSPALGAGANIGIATDQVGNARVLANPAIGAVEVLESVATVSCPIDVTTNTDSGVGSLRQAILDANSNISDCVIYLDGGETYTIGSNLPIVTGTDVGGKLSIISTGTLNAVIDGNNLHRPLTMTSGSNLTLSKITIQNGSADQGGGIYNRDGDLTISDCLITQNEAIAGNGGGIFSNSVNKAVSILIDNSTISLNSSSTSGGGVFNRGQALLSISNSTISNNTTTLWGAGIVNADGSFLSISSSTISGNVAGSAGGGIYNTAGSVSISSSSITENRGISHSAGGISSNAFANLTIQASTIANNQTDGSGGAIHTYSGSVNATTLIKNCTISGNIALGEGGAIHSRYNTTPNDITLQHTTLSNNSGATHGGFLTTGATTVTLENSIIANSTGNDFELGAGGILTLVTATIVEDGTLVHANASSGDPLLGALTLNSGFLIHPLQAGSPALGSGANIGIATDQVGNARILASPSIGAVEITEVSGACMVLVAPAGVTNTWIGCTNSDWNTATNWSTGTVPTASDVVYVPIAAANQLVIDEVATCAKMVVQIGAKCHINYNAGGRLQIKF